MKVKEKGKMKVKAMEEEVKQCVARDVKLERDPQTEETEERSSLRDGQSQWE